MSTLEQQSQEAFESAIRPFLRSGGKIQNDPELYDMFRAMWDARGEYERIKVEQEAVKEAK